MASALAAAQVDLNTLDLTAPDLFTDGPPHALFSRLRRERPVHWNNTHDGPGFWSLTRHADITRVNKNCSLFKSSGGVFFRDDAPIPLEMARQLMLSMDPPDHTKYRKIVQKVFTPKMIAQQQGAIAERVGELIDTVCESGRCDIVTDIALPLPMSVISAMLGVPTADLPALTSAFLRIEQATMQPGPDSLAAVSKIASYVTELVAERNRNPGDDLVSSMVAAEVDGERLTQIETTLFFTLLMMAGADTTRNALAGGMVALMDNPDQLRALSRRANRSDGSELSDSPHDVVATAVEEILRWVTPIMYFRRTATADTEINGQPIAEGARVVMWYASANRDEASFNDPDRFDITRTAGDHTSFGGGGRHFCLGASLARLELRTALGEIVRRMPGLHAAGQPRRALSTWTNNLASVPVEFTPTAPRAGHR